MAAPTFDLLKLAPDFSLDIDRWHVELGEDLLVQDDLRVGAVDDRTQSEFRAARRSDLAHKDEIERSLKRLGDLEADRHAAARKRKDNRFFRLVGHQLAGELASGIGTVLKAQVVRLHLMSLLD